MLEVGCELHRVPDAVAEVAVEIDPGAREPPLAIQTQARDHLTAEGGGAQGRAQQSLDESPWLRRAPGEVATGIRTGDLEAVVDIDDRFMVAHRFSGKAEDDRGSQRQGRRIELRERRRLGDAHVGERSPAASADNSSASSRLSRARRSEHEVREPLRRERCPGHEPRLLVRKLVGFSCSFERVRGSGAQELP